MSRLSCVALDGIDTIGKTILTRRAKKLFGRSFGPESFVVKKLDFFPRPGYRNHVQIRLESVGQRDVVLLAFESFIEEDLLPFLTGKVRIAVGCTKCGCAPSNHWNTWLPRTTKGFRRGIENLLERAETHSCA